MDEVRSEARPRGLAFLLVLKLSLLLLAQGCAQRERIRGPAPMPPPGYQETILDLDDVDIWPSCDAAKGVGR